jgi:hypothetical protein
MNFPATLQAALQEAIAQKRREIEQQVRIPKKRPQAGVRIATAIWECPNHGPY